MYEVALENSFSFASPEYGELYQRSCATAFQHPIWLDRLYRTAAAVRAAPQIVTVRLDRQLAMVLPLMSRRRGPLRVIEFADLGVSDYAAPICQPGMLEVLAANPAVRSRLRAVLHACDVIRLKKVLDGHAGLDRLLGAQHSVRLEVSAHSVRLHEPFGDWRKGVMSASRQSSLARKRRALARKGAVRFEQVRESGRIVRAMEAMREFRKIRFAGDLFQQPAFYDFYLAVALEGAACGYARTFALWLDDQLIGVLMGLSHRKRFLFLLAGMDFAAHGAQSIGALAFEDLARDCIAQGDAVLDFTIGDEPYKQEFGARPEPLWMVTVPVSLPGRAGAWMAHRRGRRGTQADLRARWPLGAYP